MADVLMFGVARPGRVLLVGTDGSTDRMPSLYKIAVGTELLENFRSDASHDVHVCDDIRRIAYFNTHLGDGRTEGTHTVRNDVHRTASHGTGEKFCEPAPHSRRFFPVVVGAGFVLGFGTDKSTIFDTCNVNGRGKDVITIRTPFRIEGYGRAALRHGAYHKLGFMIVNF